MVTAAELKAIDDSIALKPTRVSHGGVSSVPQKFFANVKNLPPESGELWVNFDVLEEKLGYVTGGVEALYSRASRIDWEEMIRGSLVNQFDNAIKNAGEGIFEPYRDQILKAVNEIPIVFESGGDYEWSIEIDFTEMGTYEEFTMGFHSEALLYERPKRGKNKRDGRVHLPYKGQRLYSDEETRTRFWESMFLGVPFITRADNEIPTEGLLDETIAERVRVWGEINKAPEWLILEYGTMKSIPAVTPQSPAHNFRDNTQRAIAEVVVRIYQEILNEADAIGRSAPEPALTPYAVEAAAAQAAFEQYRAKGAIASLEKLSNNVTVIRGAKGRFMKIY